MKQLTAYLQFFQGPFGKALAMAAIGGCALFVSASFVVGGGIADSARSASAALEREARTLRKEAKKIAAADKARSAGASLRSVPMFIDRIGELAAENDARVGQVRPIGPDAALFEIDVAANYRALMNFVAALEELDIQVARFALTRRADGAPQAPMTAKLAIRPRNDAQRLSVPRLAAVRAALAAGASRDPFEALAADGDSGGARQDLTYTYRLTGISILQPSGERTATINSYDYEAGDVLDGREIVAIAADRVLLNALGDRRGEKFVIGFRARNVEAERKP